MRLVSLADKLACTEFARADIDRAVELLEEAVVLVSRTGTQDCTPCIRGIWPWRSVDATN